MRPAHWSRSSPAWRRCCRPRPASSTATATCWRWKGNIEAHGGSVVLRCPVERIERDGARPVPPRHRRREPRRHHLQQPRAVARACMPPSWRHAGLRGRLSAARDLLRQGPILRALGPLAVQAPHLPDAGRRLARPARHRRHRRALQVWPRHRMDPRHRLQLRAREARTSSWISSAAIIRGSRSSACTPTTRASAPSCTAKASRCPTSPSTAPTQHGQDGLVALYGIESPGLTASLAIGEVVAGMLSRRG